MKAIRQRLIETAYWTCFAILAIDAIAWIAHDLMASSKHTIQNDWYIFYDVGSLPALLVALRSIPLFKTDRTLAAAGIAISLLWMVWAALPRF